MPIFQGEWYDEWEIPFDPNEHPMYHHEREMICQKNRYKPLANKRQRKIRATMRWLRTIWHDVLTDENRAHWKNVLAETALPRPTPDPHATSSFNAFANANFAKGWYGVYPVTYEPYPWGKEPEVCDYILAGETEQYIGAYMIYKPEHPWDWFTTTYVYQIKPDRVGTRGQMRNTRLITYRNRWEDDDLEYWIHGTAPYPIKMGDTVAVLIRHLRRFNFYPSIIETTVCLP